MCSFSSVVTLGFEQDAYQFTEGETITLVVEVHGQIDSSISHEVFSEGFINETGILPAGFSAPNFTITVSGTEDDIALEPDEVHIVTLYLREPVRPQVAITTSITTVTIVDNDGELCLHIII